MESTYGGMFVSGHVVPVGAGRLCTRVGAARPGRTDGGMLLGPVAHVSGMQGVLECLQTSKCVTAG
jgi:hypothetical protein